MANLEELLKKAAKGKGLVGSGLMSQMVRTVAALDYEDLVKAVPDFLPRLGEVLEARAPEMEEIDVEKATDFMLKYLPKIVKKVTSSDAEIKNELAATEDMTFNVKAGNILEMCVKIKKGKIALSPGLAEERDFFIDVPTGELLRLMTGEEDAISGFMGGGIAMWRDGDEGDMTKAMSILPLITVVLEKLGLERMM